MFGLRKLPAFKFGIDIGLIALKVHLTSSPLSQTSSGAWHTPQSTLRP
jgi:hypothetical protein